MTPWSMIHGRDEQSFDQEVTPRGDGLQQACVFNGASNGQVRGVAEQYHSAFFFWYHSVFI